MAPPYVTNWPPQALAPGKEEVVGEAGVEAPLHPRHQTVIGAVTVIPCFRNASELRIGQIVLCIGEYRRQQSRIGGVVNRLRQHVGVSGPGKGDTRRALIDDL